MKFIPTFAALLLANTIYADYNACAKGPNDGETGRCYLYTDTGAVKFSTSPRMCLKVGAKPPLSSVSLVVA
ncbi:hypothetical protein Vi05172_g1444 [Venturia inaequalis]|nr:hypothetical protein Vi05172_g1444 [Venturia inaequalis]